MAAISWVLLTGFAVFLWLIDDSESQAEDPLHYYGWVLGAAAPSLLMFMPQRRVTRSCCPWCCGVLGTWSIGCAALSIWIAWHIRDVWWGLASVISIVLVGAISFGAALTYLNEIRQRLATRVDD